MRVFRPELGKGSGVKGGADTLGQRVVKMEVVEHGEPHGQHLPRNKEVAEVGAGEGAAGQGIPGYDGIIEGDGR